MSTYTNYFKNYYQANKERIKQYTMEYYEKNKERLQEYRKEYSKHYYQNVLKAKRSKPRTVKPKTVKPKKGVEAVEANMELSPRGTSVYAKVPYLPLLPLLPTQIIRGNFTLCFD